MSNCLTVEGSVEFSHVYYADTGLLHGQLRYPGLCHDLERLHNELQSTKKHIITISGLRIAKSCRNPLAHMM